MQEDVPVMSGGVCFGVYHAFAVSREGFPDVQGPDGILHVSLDITDTVSPPRLLYRSAMQSLREHTHNAAKKMGPNQDWDPCVM